VLETQLAGVSGGRGGTEDSTEQSAVSIQPGIIRRRLAQMSADQKKPKADH
jgi:hypothetical protein